MRKKNIKSILQTGTVVLCLLAVTSTTTLVHAAPSSKDLKSEQQNLSNQLTTLNDEFDTLCEEIFQASDDLDALTAEIEKAKLDLAAAKLNEDEQYEAMKQRIKFMYEGGEKNLLSILFQAENMGEFLNKAEYINTISDYDRDMLSEFQEAVSNVEKKNKKLEDKQAKLQELQDNLIAKQNALTSQISVKKDAIRDYDKKIAKAEAREEAARKAAERAKEKEMSGSDPANPGTLVIPATTDNVALLAALVYTEGGIGGYDGMLAVATVVMNRVESPRYPNTIKGVIYQKGQFAVVPNGALSRALSKGVPATAYSVAQATLGGARHKKVLNCYEFRAAGFTSHKGINIGDNIFF